MHSAPILDISMYISSQSLFVKEHCTQEKVRRMWSTGLRLENLVGVFFVNYPEIGEMHIMFM